MGITVRLRISGARETLRAFRDLPKDASRELKAANNEISKDLATKIAAAARASDAQSAAVAASVKARSDRVPSVVAGGGRRATKQRRRSKGQGPTTAGDLVFGSNFGATMLNQYRPHTGAGEDDYWFFRTVERENPAIVREWEDAADRVLREWGS